MHLAVAVARVLLAIAMLTATFVELANYLVLWLLVQHPRRVRLRTAGLVVIFPLAWVVFTLIRGGLVPDELAGTSYFYPYPFLNPHLDGGWIAVARWIGALAVLTLVLGLLALLA